MTDKIDYIYTDKNYNPLYKQCRIDKEDGKAFYGYRYENDRWVKGLKGVERVLYNLPEVISAIEKIKKIYFVEGEKDVETLKSKGLVATTISNGAKSPLPQDISNTLKNADVIIIPDNDVPGQEFAIKVANSLTKSNIIKVLNLTKKWPELKEKGDITDVFEMVNNDEEVLKKLEELEKETSIYNEKTKLNKGEIKKGKGKSEKFFKEKIVVDGEEIEIDLKVPRAYRFEDNKIWEIETIYEEKVWVIFSYSLVLIKSIFENLETGEQKLELVYYKPNKKEWKSLIVDKNTINNFHNILLLGNKGIPITSLNSGSWVKYFSILEQENYDRIPTIRTVDRLGWVDNIKENVFIPYVNEDVKLEAEENASSWLEGFKSKGKLENWIKVMKPLRENNIFRVVLASGFVPPLLKYIGARTFIINVWRI